MTSLPPEQKAATNAVTRYIVIALTLTAVAVIIWRIADAIIVAFGGIVIAALLRSLASALERVAPISEKKRLGIVVAVVLIATALLAWFFGRTVTEEVSKFQQLLPQQIDKIVDWLRGTSMGSMVVDSVKNSAGSSQMASHVGVAAGAVLTGLLDAVLMFFLGIYFAFDPNLYLSGALRLLPPARRADVRRALTEAGEALRKWLFAQAIAMVVIGALVGVGLALLGVPLALLLAVIAGLFEFVPVVGPIVFSVPGILIAFSKSPQLALYTLILYVVVQQFESNLIIPLLQRWAIRLPPVVSLLSVLAGGLLLGPAGIVFATPLAVVVIALVKNLYVEDTLEHRPAPLHRPGRMMPG